MRSRSLVVAVLLVVAALVGCSTATRQSVGEDLKKAATEQPTWKVKPTTNKPRKNVIVQFSDASLHPSVARVTEGGNVAWVNYSASSGAVVFPDSFRDALTCGEPRPEFAKVAAGYQSTAITGGGGEDTTLPCPLKPGEYEYQINLFRGEFAAQGEGMSNPTSTMHGKIVVE